MLPARMPTDSSFWALISSSSIFFRFVMSRTVSMPILRLERVNLPPVISTITIDPSFLRWFLVYMALGPFTEKFANVIDGMGGFVGKVGHF